MSQQNRNNLPPDVQARIDFVRSVVPKRKPHRLAKAVLTLILIAGLIGLFWHLSSSTPKKIIKPAVSGHSLPKPVTLNADATTTNYTSKFFGLTFTYPTSWSLKDSGKGLLSLTSPLTSLQSPSGNSHIGNITFIVRQPPQLPAAASSSSNLAVLNSSLVNYANPSADQSGQTYISFVQYSNTNIVGSLDGVYVTGNLGYQKDQFINPSDLLSTSPLIFVSFSQCSNKACTTFVPLTIAASSWSGSSLGQIITNIIQSFIFS